MTARNELIADYALHSSSEQGASLRIAQEVLRQVRFPEAIYLRDIAYDPMNGSGTGTFMCAPNGSTSVSVGPPPI